MAPGGTSEPQPAKNAKEKNKLIQDMLLAKNGGAKTQKPIQKKTVEFHCETLD